MFIDNGKTLTTRAGKGGRGVHEYVFVSPRGSEKGALMFFLSVLRFGGLHVLMSAYHFNSVVCDRLWEL